LLPEEIRAKLHDLTLENGEMRGMLVYEEINDLGNTICPIEKLVILHRGTSSSARMTETDNRFIREFISSTNYSFVDSHTHTIGSMRLYGDQVAEQFSAGDLAGISETQRVNPKYMHLLSTPKKLILHGIDKPQLLLVTDAKIRKIIPDYVQRQRCIDEKVMGLLKQGY